MNERVNLDNVLTRNLVRCGIIGVLNFWFSYIFAKLVALSTFYTSSSCKMSTYSLLCCLNNNLNKFVTINATLVARTRQVYQSSKCIHHRRQKLRLQLPLLTPFGLNLLVVLNKLTIPLFTIFYYFWYHDKFA